MRAAFAPFLVLQLHLLPSVEHSLKSQDVKLHFTTESRSISFDQKKLPKAVRYSNKYVIIDKSQGNE